MASKPTATPVEVEKIDPALFKHILECMRAGEPKCKKSPTCVTRHETIKECAAFLKRVIHTLQLLKGAREEVSNYESKCEQLADDLETEQVKVARLKADNHKLDVQMHKYKSAAKSPVTSSDENSQDSAVVEQRFLKEQALARVTQMEIDADKCRKAEKEWKEALQRSSKERSDVDVRCARLQERLEEAHASRAAQKEPLVVLHKIVKKSLPQMLHVLSMGDGQLLLTALTRTGKVDEGQMTLFDDHLERHRGIGKQDDVDKSQTSAFGHRLDDNEYIRMPTKKERASKSPARSIARPSSSSTSALKMDTPDEEVSESLVIARSDDSMAIDEKAVDGDVKPSKSAVTTDAASTLPDFDPTHILKCVQVVVRCSIDIRLPPLSSVPRLMLERRVAQIDEESGRAVETESCTPIASTSQAMSEEEDSADEAGEEERLSPIEHVGRRIAKPAAVARRVATRQTLAKTATIQSTFGKKATTKLPSKRKALGGGGTRAKRKPTDVKMAEVRLPSATIRQRGSKTPAITSRTTPIVPPSTPTAADRLTKELKSRVYDVLMKEESTERRAIQLVQLELPIADVAETLAWFVCEGARQMAVDYWLPLQINAGRTERAVPPLATRSELDIHEVVDRCSSKYDGLFVHLVRSLVRRLVRVVAADVHQCSAKAVLPACIFRIILLLTRSSIAISADGRTGRLSMVRTLLDALARHCVPEAVLRYTIYACAVLEPTDAKQIFDASTDETSPLADALQRLPNAQKMVQPMIDAYAPSTLVALIDAAQARRPTDDIPFSALMNRVTLPFKLNAFGSDWIRRDGGSAAILLSTAVTKALDDVLRQYIGAASSAEHSTLLLDNVRSVTSLLTNSCTTATEQGDCASQLLLVTRLLCAHLVHHSGGQPQGEEGHYIVGSFLHALHLAHSTIDMSSPLGLTISDTVTHLLDVPPLRDVVQRGIDLRAANNNTGVT